MLEAFDEDDDVENVYHNSEVPDETQEKVDKFIEENTFRT